VTALYPCTVTHARSTPLRNVFSYRSYLWLTDLDQPPVLPLLLRPLAGFVSRDHLGDPDATIRSNVDAYLATQGVVLRGGRVLMLASARVLGYVFNPLSVFWCFDDDGDLVCVIAEVHNTYGQRHCYLLRTGPGGAARVEKAFYVSPFEQVQGEYQMSLPVPGDRLTLTITLHRPGQAPFSASVRGRRQRYTPRGFLTVALRYPLAPLMASVRIRRQGIGLWLRGLPVVPRPDHETQEAVQ
jgi:hypothetical protein